MLWNDGGSIINTPSTAAWSGFARCRPIAYPSGADAHSHNRAGIRRTGHPGKCDLSRANAHRNDGQSVAGTDPAGRYLHPDWPFCRCVGTGQFGITLLLASDLSPYVIDTYPAVDGGTTSIRAVPPRRARSAPKASFISCFMRAAWLMWTARASPAVNIATATGCTRSRWPMARESICRRPARAERARRCGFRSPGHN